MQAVMAEIKTRLSALKNDSQPPEELHMRVCMTKTVELMKILRNTYVESGLYCELVISDTSKVLGKCRHLLGLLLWNVSCKAVGGKVNEEMSLSFHQTMDVVIAHLDNVINDAANTQKLWDAGLREKGQKELTELIPESSISKFSFQKINEPNEQLNAFQKSDIVTSGGNRGDGWNRNSPKQSSLIGKLRKKNINHCRRQNPDWRAKWRLLVGSWLKDSIVVQKEKSLISIKALPQPEKSLTILTTESSLYSRTESTLSDVLIKEPEKPESQPGVITEHQKDVKVLWIQKNKPLTQTSSTSSKNDYQTATSNESPLWRHEGVSVIPASTTTSDPVIKDLPKNNRTRTSLKTESTQDVQVSLSQRISIFKDLPHQESKMSFVGPIQGDGSKTSQETKSQEDVQTLWVQRDKPMTQTSSSSTDSIYKELPRPEKVERQPSLRTESPRVTPMVQENSTFFDLLYKNLSQSDNEEKEKHLGTESQLRVHKGESRIQTFTKPSDPVIKTKNDETLARLQVFLSQIDKPKVPKISKFKDLPQSKSKVSFVGPIQSYGRETRASTEKLQDVEVLWDKKKDKLMTQTSSSSSDFLFKDLSCTEKVNSQKSLTSERQQDSPMVQAITDLPQPEPKMKIVDSIHKDASKARSRPKSLKEPPQPVEGDIQAKGSTENLPELQVLWAQIDKLKVENQKNLRMESLKNLLTMRAQIDKLMAQATTVSPDPLVTPTIRVSTEIPSTNTTNLPVTSQQPNRKRFETKPTVSFFSVGKTFGDHHKRVLQWCRDRTKAYGLPMYEFSESWRSGRALVAIIHSYRADLIEPAFLSQKAPLETITYGAIVAKSLGVVGKDGFVHECLQKKPNFCVVFMFVRNLERCLVSNENRSRS